MLNLAICDDDKAVCSQMEDILQKLGQTFSVEIKIEVFFSGEELYRFLLDGVCFDAIFLDIELNIMNGIDLGKKIRDEMSDEITQIIYISGKEQYAMELFKVRPTDFIIKPVTYEKIYDVFNTVLKIEQNGSNFFEYQNDRSTCRVYIKDIIYFESENRKINIVTTHGRYSFYGTLDKVYDKVKKFGFLDIHKSYIVNYSHIVKFQYKQVTMSDKTVLHISQPNRKKIREYHLEMQRGSVKNEFNLL